MYIAAEILDYNTWCRRKLVQYSQYENRNSIAQASFGITSSLRVEKTQHATYLMKQLSNLMKHLMHE